MKIHRATKAIAALGAVTLALAVAGPASAADSQPTTPTDGNGKRYCPVVQPDLSIIWYRDGSVLKTGKDHVLVCDDGVWDDDIHARPVGPFGGISGGTATQASAPSSSATTTAQR